MELLSQTLRYHQLGEALLDNRKNYSVVVSIVEGKELWMMIPVDDVAATARDSGTRMFFTRTPCTYLHTNNTNQTTITPQFALTTTIGTHVTGYGLGLCMEWGAQQGLACSSKKSGANLR